VGIFSWFKRAPVASKLSTTVPVVREKPLYEQFQRIGGGLTPRDVSWILAEADAGRPYRLIDLYNESKQKDGHLQSCTSTRDSAVALCDVAFVAPEGSRLKDKKAVELCTRIVGEFENWPTLVEHLTSAYATGHATAEIFWRKTSDGYLLPYRAEPIAPRDFVFSIADGRLRYAPRNNPVEIDLLGDNPGRIVQIQRRIVGDVPAREGLMRVLVWAALFRNWTLRDWIALGEVGWKPWRIGKYKTGTHQTEIDRLVAALENIGASGVGVVPENTELAVEWPKNNQSASTGTHRELFDALGREMSKAVLGQTTSIEASPNGDRASTQTRDNIRLDIRERDAVAVAAVLRYQMFAHAVALNISDSAVTPVPWFQTDEATDQLAFASAVEKLANAKVRIGAKWVRDEIGAPEPKDDEEVIGQSDAQPDPNASDPNQPPKPAQNEAA
jgi:phage gp29-like protein